MTVVPFPRPISADETKARIVAALDANVSMTLADYAALALYEWNWPVERLHKVFNDAARATFSIGTKGGAA